MHCSLQNHLCETSLFYGRSKRGGRFSPLYAPQYEKVGIMWGKIAIFGKLIRVIKRVIIAIPYHVHKNTSYRSFPFVDSGGSISRQEKNEIP